MPDIKIMVLFLSEVIKKKDIYIINTSDNIWKQ